MKSGQKGFAVIETLLVLILLAIVGFTGYYVWHTQKDTNSTLDNAAKTSNNAPAPTGEQTYQGDGFTLKYPAAWKLTKGTSESPGDTFSPKSNSSTDSISAPFIYIEAGATSYTKASDDWPVNGSGHAGTVLQSKSLTTPNGYSSYQVVTTFDNSKLYTYDIVHNGKAVDINLEMSDSDSTSQAVLNSMAASIRFE